MHSPVGHQNLQKLLYCGHLTVVRTCSGTHTCANLRLQDIFNFRTCFGYSEEAKWLFLRLFFNLRYGFFLRIFCSVLNSVSKHLGGFNNTCVISALGFHFSLLMCVRRLWHRKMKVHCLAQRQEGMGEARRIRPRRARDIISLKNMSQMSIAAVVKGFWRAKPRKLPLDCHPSCFLNTGSFQGEPVAALLVGSTPGCGPRLLRKPRRAIPIAFGNAGSERGNPRRLG